MSTTIRSGCITLNALNENLVDYGECHFIERRICAKWWRTERNDVKSGQILIRDKRVGNLLISMFVPTLVRVQGLDKLGRAKVVTYLLPPGVVEYRGRLAICNLAAINTRLFLSKTELNRRKM